MNRPFRLPFLALAVFAHSLASAQITGGTATSQAAGTSGQGIDTASERTSFLTNAGALGASRITEGNKVALSRWWARAERSNSQTLGVYDASRRRVVDLGDSTTAPFGRALSRRMGYGGSFVKAKAAPGLTTTGTTTGDQWTRTLSGSVTRLANTQTLTYSPATTLTGVWVQYLAKSGNGSVQLAFETNKTGGYTNSTANWTIENYVRWGYGYSGSPAILCNDSTAIEVGMSVAGTNIPGGTTVTAVNADTTISTTATTTNGSPTITVASVAGLTRGMRVESATGQGGLITSIAPGSNQVTLSGDITSTGSGVAFQFRGKNIILSANATGAVSGNLTFSRSDAGSSSGGTGTLNTDNSGAEKFCTAYIPVPNFSTGADYYNIRLTATGNVDICGIGTEAGAFGFAYSSAGVRPGGVMYGDFGEGSKWVSTHFNTTPADVFNRSLGWINPDIITFKGLNDWNLATLTAEVSPGVTLWDQYTTKIRDAAPNALLVVFSTHVTQSNPLADSKAYGWVLMDDWMRDWCVRNNALFIDARQAYTTNSSIQGDLSNLTSDGLHQNNVGDDSRGLGEEWNVTVAMNAIEPVLRSTGPLSARNLQNNATRRVPGSANRQSLNIPDPAGIAPTLVGFSYDVPARSRAFLGFSPDESLSNGGVTYGNENFTGIGMNEMGTGSNTSPGALELISNGSVVVAFGCYHFNGQVPRGAFFGGNNTIVPDGHRNNGWRFLQPAAALGNAKGLVAASQTGNTASTFTIVSGESVSALGTDQWSWFAETGNVAFPKTITAGGTTGAQTINKLTGSVNFAASATSLVVTNSLVTTGSVIICTVGTNDSTMKSVQAVAGSGSFTLYPNANPTTETRVNFSITN